MEAEMLKAQYEALGTHIIPAIFDRDEEEVIGSIDADIPDQPWVLPHRTDLRRSLRISAANRSDIVIKQVVRNSTGHCVTEPQAPAEAYSALVYLDGFRACDVLRDERPAQSRALMPGAMLINDMRHSWRASFNGPFNVVGFFIPQKAVDEIAEEQGARRGVILRGPAEAGWTDPTFNDLAQSLLPALAKPEQTNKLFTDHLTRAVVAHLTANYGSLQFKSPSRRGGLAPWQERRAKEMITTELAGSLSLSELAAACRLSPSYFSVAFKRSVGHPPYKWLLMQRIERAKHLILATNQPLCEIALDAGFADQSHLTRVFTQHLGASPAAWRRAMAV
jgi:AraC family transcriptional regulator